MNRGVERGKLNMARNGGSTVMADIDEMMYSCGVEVLHPGGLEKTFEMARDCRIGAGSKVLDIGSGKGTSAIHLAEKYGCHVTGVDSSQAMVDYANQAAKVRGHAEAVTFRNLDAQALPFDDAAFDVVLAECSTVLMDKERAFSEFIRVTRPGGHVADLEMSWRQIPTDAVVQRAYELWEGFSTKTLDEWRDFYDSMGLAEIKINDFSDTLDDIEKLYLKWLGVAGIAKMAWILAGDASLRRGMAEYTRFFRDAKDFVGYGYFVGTKRTVDERA
jgi:ubiquinone/menaquinone biosynthesis C-methylase UbiE